MILIVDDLAIFREPIAACLRLGGYQTICAVDGNDGLDKARAHRPGLILLDMAMPGMDGLAFLKQLRAEPAIANTPVIMLTAISDRARVVDAIRLGAREYLLKSRFSTKDLLEKIRRQYSQSPAAAASPTPPAQPASADAPRSPAKPVVIPKLLERDECLNRAREAVQAKTLSGVVGQVISMASSPRADTKELASFIARDPVLSARVLMTANSAAYSSGKHGMVTSIPQAVKQIGFSTIRNIAVAIGIFEVMPKDGIDGFNPIRCWQHSFAVAQLCEQLEMLHDPDVAPVAYIVGLCHELGEMLTRAHFSKECQQIFELHEQSGKPIEEIERHMLGITRANLNASFLESLGLPDSIRRPIDAYHRHANSPPADDHLAQILRVGDRYANGLLLANGPGALVSPFIRAELRLLVGADEPAQPDAETFRASITSLTAMLAKLGSAEEAQLMAPLLPRSKARVWMVRDRLLSTFDPIKTALGCLATVELHDTLPTAADAGSYDAIVVGATKPGMRGMSASDIRGCPVSKTGQTPPVLWLLGAREGPDSAGAVEPRDWSLSIRELAEFITSAASGARVKKAAA